MLELSLLGRVGDVGNYGSQLHVEEMVRESQLVVITDPERRG